MDPAIRASELAHKLNNNLYEGAVDEVKTLEALRVAMGSMADANEECVQAIQTHANDRTFLVACQQKLFKLATMIHQTASLQISDLRTREGFSSMHFAADAGDLDFIEYLNQHKVPLDSMAQHNWTPLCSASVKGHAACIAYFLENGAKADIEAGPHKMTPVRLVQTSNNQAAIQEFAKRNIKP
jgi:hypothetical protein